MITQQSLPSGAPRHDMLLGDIEARVCNAGSECCAVFGGAFDGGYYTQQHPRELARLIQLLKIVGPVRLYLEIGVASAGTTRLIHELAGFERAVLIDDGKHPRAIYREENLSSFRNKCQLFIGDSHSGDAADFLANAARGESADVVLIDGDHSREGVLRDIDLVLRVCCHRTILVFHDILLDGNNPFGLRAGVGEVWRSCKLIQPILEICDSGWIGIGVAKARLGVL